MPSTATFDEGWKLFQETSRLFHEQSAETDRRFREQSAETTAQMREMDRKFRERSAETDRKIQEIAAQIREIDQKFREKSAETGHLSRVDDIERVTETSKIIERTKRKLDKLGGECGEFADDVLVPGCFTLFAPWGITVHEVSQRVRTTLDDGREMWIDLLAANSGVVVLVVVRSSLIVDDVRDHLGKLQQFKDFFPNYGDCRVMGAVAGIVTEDDADRFARDQGLFVIVHAGEQAALANEPAFKPHTW